MNFDFSINNINQSNSILGLEICHDTLRYVELVKHQKKLSLKKWGVEPLLLDSTNRDDNIVNTIIKLKRQLNLNHCKVISNIDSISVRHTLIKVPLMTYDETELWLTENIAQFIPAGTIPSEIIFSFYIYADDNEQQEIILTIAKSSDVIEYLQLFEQADVKVVSLGSGVLDINNAFAFYDDSYYNENYAIINITEQKTNIIICVNGIINLYHEFYFALHRDNDEVIYQQLTVEIKKVLVDHWVDTLGKVRVTNVILTGAKIYFSHIGKLLEEIVDIEIGQPLKGTLNNDTILDPEYALAAGLAVKGHYPMLNTINLLPLDKKLKIEEEKGKNKALKIILYAGLIFLSIYSVILLTGGFVNTQLNATQDDLIQMNSRIIALEKLKHENQNLSKEIKQARTIIVNRSNNSQLLSEISRILPKKIWLREINFLQNTDNKRNIIPNISLSGLTFSEQNIAQFLKVLEDSKYFFNVKLTQTNTFSAKEIFEKTKIKRVPLIRFNITCDIKHIK